MLIEKIPLKVKGHLTIKDDLGNILVDKDNAIHPMNMSRVIARALAKEDNYFIHRMAFGNGGTQVGISLNINYNTPNVSGGFNQTLYNETYSEIINESDINIDTGPGSNDQDLINAQNSVVSTEPGIVSVVSIVVELNESEPIGQSQTDILAPIEESEAAFVFDEIGLFTTGLPLVATPGYQNVNVGTKFETIDTGLATSTLYDFQISIDSNPSQLVTITTPVSGSGTGGEILYSDLLLLLNSAPAMVGASANISQGTFGKLKFTSASVGNSSDILLVDGGGPNTALFASLTDFFAIEVAVSGQNAGVQNDSITSTNEAERMITHVIFSPVLKSANRKITIVYNLTISVSA